MKKSKETSAETTSETTSEKVRRYPIPSRAERLAEALENMAYWQRQCVLREAGTARAEALALAAQWRREVALRGARTQINP